MTSQTAHPKTYYATLDGNYGHFATVAELKVWAEDLIRRFSWLQGKKCSIWKAVGISGDWVQYKHARTIVVGE